MPRFTLTTMLLRPDDPTLSRITDLALGPNGTQLYSTTRYDGRITRWEIADAPLALQADHTHAGTPRAGNTPQLTFLGDQLITGGGSGGQWVTRAVDTDGALGTAQDIAARFDTPLISPVPVPHANGTSSVYAGQTGRSGLVQMQFDASGTLTGHSLLAQGPGSPVTALTRADIAGTQMLYTATASHVSAWEVASTGALTLRHEIGTAEGLWISDPSAMISVTVAGVRYIILGSAGSDTLTVLEANAQGTLTLTDHILDDRNTRFEGVTALATTSYAGATWIFAGGADDGISAFEVLPGGRLLHRAKIADSNAMTLANISALSAIPDTTGISLFAASSTEAGLTRLHLEIDPDDQVIIDGAGADVLRGGAGADIFVMGADGQGDTIADFTPGEDRLDLGAWAGLRSKSQLFFAESPDGMILRYGDETLTLITADGTAITAADLPQTDLLGSARVSSDPEIGLPGPLMPVPDLPERPVPAPGTPAPTGPLDRVEDYGSASDDRVQGGAGDDRLYGQGGQDRLRGGEGADLLFGGDGADQLWGEAGADLLFGGAGREMGWRTGTMQAGTEGDMLVGGSGDDQLFGQAGADTLDGGAGHDTLTGGSGRDVFIFRSGQDVIRDFDPVLDQLLLDPDLWEGTLTPAAAVTRHAVVSNGALTLQFDSTNSLRLEGITETELLITQTLLWDIDG